jgi:hypothetical protein
MSFIESISSQFSLASFIADFRISFFGAVNQFSSNPISIFFSITNFLNNNDITADKDNHILVATSMACSFSDFSNLKLAITFVSDILYTISI